MRTIGFFLFAMLIGSAGCRAPNRAAGAIPNAPASAPQAKATGPLSQQDAEREALKAVARYIAPDHTLSIASVKDEAEIYSVCVRIDPPKTGEKKLPEHWTVDIPKGGISAKTCDG